MKYSWLAPVVVSLGLTSLTRAQAPLTVVDATNKRVLFCDDFDGHLTGSQIDLTSAGAIDPVHALNVLTFNLWVSDRTTDTIYRMDFGGGSLGTITTGLDDIRGMVGLAGRIYVANRGNANGAPGPSIVIFDTNGNPMGSFPVSDPDGVTATSSGELLVGNVSGHDLDRYSTTGTFLGTFHDSDGVTGIDAPAQITRIGCRGHVLAAGAGASPGIYEYDASGVQIIYHALASSARGVQPLRNGNLLYTDANGIHVRDAMSGSTIDVLTGIDAQFVGLGDPELPTSYPFCYGGAGSTPCPCGNNAPAGCREGCLNSFGIGAQLEGGGVNSLSADTFSFVASGMPSTASALFFQGTTMINSGNGVGFGDGLRCAGGSVVRLGTKTSVGGVARYPEPGDVSISVKGMVPGPVVRTYQVWYRNVATFCTPQGFNLSNGFTVQWIP